jgi:DNA-binding Xre family transcriptional regulator
MKKKELQAAAKLSSATMSKLRHGQNVTTDILVRVCGVLECRVEDIMEILPEDATVTGVEDDHE